MKKKHYLAPAVEIVGIDISYAVMQATSWSTDNGETGTGIIEGNPDNRDDEYGDEGAKGFGGYSWDEED